MKDSINKNFNIETLVPKTINARPHNNGRLDIATMTSRKENKVIIQPYILAETIQRRKELLKQKHNEVLARCWDNIQTANKCSITDIVFRVPSTMPDCMDYDPIKCMEFICQTLEENYIYTLIISKTEIFITWKDIDKTIEEKKNETSTKDQEEV